MTSSFIPRQVFHAGDSIPRTYFLGHHKKGLDEMRKMLSIVDLVVECRDYRIPASSINPLFEEALGEKKRMIVYTKADLAESDSGRKKVCGDISLCSFFFFFFFSGRKMLTVSAVRLLIYHRDG